MLSCMEWYAHTVKNIRIFFLLWRLFTNCLNKNDIMKSEPGNSATVMEIGIQGSILAPTLYKSLDTHQHSKNHIIRGYFKGNLHVLEIVEKKVFLAEKAMISEFFQGEIRGTVSQICESELHVFLE